MNPAYVFLISISLAAAFWLGFWTGDDEGGDFWPNCPAFLFNVGLVVATISSIVLMVSHFLQQ